jgi:hypothetical protein
VGLTDLVDIGIIVVEFLVGVEEGCLVAVELVVRWCEDEGGGLEVVVGWGCMVVVFILVGVVTVG